jgi:hypothetical protein
VIPNKAFTFAKVWMAAAHLEVRQKDLTAARKILGMAIGERNKEKNRKSKQSVGFLLVSRHKLVCFVDKPNLIIIYTAFLA